MTGESTRRAGPTDPDGVGTGRGFDRFVNFSDAVVAIAITLLGLPLVDLVPPEDGRTAWAVLAQNSAQLGAFVFTFWVVAALWLAHHRVLGYFRGFDGVLMNLNLVFLLAIVVVPFPSQWVGEVGFDGGVGTLYLGILALASGTLGLMGYRGSRHPALLEDWARPGGASPLRSRRAVVFTCFFVVTALLALPYPDQASWLMLTLIPISLSERYLLDRPRPAADAPRP